MGAGASAEDKAAAKAEFSAAVSKSSPEELKEACSNLPAAEKARLLETIAGLQSSEETISFAHIAKEWRMKYAENELKGGAVKVDKLFNDEFMEKVKALDGLVSVQRAVCGGCNDVKFVIKMTKDGFEKWAGAGFAPEADFIEQVKKIEGITSVDTQPYTFENVAGEDNSAVAPASGEAIGFNHIAKEWRMKYAENGLKGGAVKVDQLFKADFLSKVTSLEGFVSVQRVVCGGCNDVKFVIKLSKNGFEKWAGAGFAPEADFIEQVKKIEGITSVETQPYTFEKM